MDKPVSRQHERDYYRYYNYPYYWGYSAIWGMVAYPGAILNGRNSGGPPKEDLTQTRDSHLRSATELTGYHIEGSDAPIGHVADFIVDAESWQVQYLVIDTHNWWFGKKVLVAPHWASRVSWDQRTIHVDLSRQAVKDSPEWNPNAPVNRDYEARLYDYYGRPVYWGDLDHRALDSTPAQSDGHPV